MALRGRSEFLDEECFFVTTTCYKWHLLEMESCKLTIRESINFLNTKYIAVTRGYVIMPNHIHLILYFKKGNQLSNWMRDLKKFTSVMIRQQIEKSGNIELLEKLRVPEKKQVFKVWQDRFDDVYLSKKKSFGDETGIHPHQPYARTLELGSQSRRLALFECDVL